MDKIEIYVVSQSPIYFSDTTCLRWIDPNLNSYDNISQKRNYCELRAQYFVWKNSCYSDNDYVGFFHYRRYLSFENSCLNSDKKILPYTIKEKPCMDYYNKNRIQKILGDADIIAPVLEYTGTRVYDRFMTSKNHHKETLDIVAQIIEEEYPEIYPFYCKYINGYGEYYGNIYIMRWKYFKQYCSFLFDVLNKYDEVSKNVYERSDGYAGERIFGAYFTWLKNNPSLKYGYLPREHYYIFDDVSHSFKKERIVNVILPPGSQRRSIITRCYKGVKTKKLIWR